MSNVMIRPWPYKKHEEVELYWLCSPYLSYNKGWIITAVFRKDNQIKMVELPWGTLPLLRLGQRYINGIPSERNAKGFIGELFIRNEEFEICSSFDMPSKLYYFYKNYKCGMEKLCKIKIGYKEYYIPCIEIIRSFFAKSKTLANYILKPNGLDFIIDKTEFIGDDINIYLSGEVPRQLANDDEVAHIIWLKYNKIANNAWNSVYNNIFKKALDGVATNPVKALATGTIIETMPPINRECKWNYRGIYNGNSVLVLEILVTDFEMPFTNINYYHPSFDKARTISNNGKVRRFNKGKNEIFELPGDKPQGGTKKNQDQPVIQISPTSFVYDGILNIKRLKGMEKESINGVQVINIKKDNDEEGCKSTSIASTQDWSGIGKLEPIEFKSLELVKGKLGNGLEEFYEVIGFLKNNYKNLDISMSEVFLHKGNRFSYYPNGDRRNCAIIAIQKENKLPSYILEVGRADGWSISTLIIHEFVDPIAQSNIEKLIYKLLIELNENNGHWERQLFNENGMIEFDMMRHMTEESVSKWAFRIASKIKFLFKY